ncbi:methyltransferase [Pseudonocardia saturnea]|uniref:Methyltransferase n=1 Tax=Pseudonocardia saturnea TaxID=33909 RepID=A0ABQ0RWA9_9PSEU|nr:methyltransferase [Pseudonocardia autotrophica]GEC24921.1 methyltransferase [Pseudonocardia saturnea]
MWSGSGGDFWAGNAARFDAGVAGYLPRFRENAAIGPGERVLDVGCGAGTTTLDAAAAAGAGGSAHGVDMSEALLSIARARATGSDRVSFAVADAQTDDLGAGGVDVVISRNGVMFFDDPAAAFANLHRALRPGGRIALQVWQPLAEQEWLTAVHRALEVPDPPADGPSPVSFGDPDRCRALLSGAGFGDIRIEGARSPMWLGSDVDEAATFQLDRVAAALAERPEPARRAAEDALRRVLAGHAGPDGVALDSAAWFIRAVRD